MAYREFGMVEVAEILRRWRRGDGIRAIARAAGVDRKTIAAYVQADVAVGVQRGGAPPSDEQLAASATAPPAGPADERERAQPGTRGPPPAGGDGAAMAGGRAAPDQDLSAAPRPGRARLLQFAVPIRARDV